MPKPRHTIDAYCIQRLKEEIQLLLGIQVNNRPSCSLLTNELQNNYGISISESTLARFFLYADKNNHFYLDTLDKLSNVARKGCNWQQYCSSVRAQRDQALTMGVHHEIDFRSTLLYINFEYSGWKVLRTYFERLEEYLNRPNYEYLGFDLGGALYRIAESNSSFENSLYKHFVSYNAVRKSYFELLADPEFKLPHYTEGLFSYGKTIDYSNVNAANDLCFYLSMLCLNEAKHGNFNTFSAYYKQLSANFNLQNIISSNVHSFNIGRFLAVQLIYNAQFKPDSFGNCFSDVILFIRNNIDSWSAYDIRLIKYFFVYGLYRTNSPDLYYRTAEKTFGFHFPEARDFKESVRLFLFNKEPNTLSWYRRWEVL